MWWNVLDTCVKLLIVFTYSPLSSCTVVGSNHRSSHDTGMRANEECNSSVDINVRIVCWGGDREAPNSSRKICEVHYHHDGGIVRSIIKGWICRNEDMDCELSATYSLRICELPCESRDVYQKEWNFNWNEINAFTRAFWESTSQSKYHRNYDAPNINVFFLPSIYICNSTKDEQETTWTLAFSD